MSWVPKQQLLRSVYRAGRSKGEKQCGSLWLGLHFPIQKQTRRKKAAVKEKSGLAGTALLSQEHFPSLSFTAEEAVAIEMLLWALDSESVWLLLEGQSCRGQTYNELIPL